MWGWIILKDPVEEIGKAVKDNDYFKIVAYSCAIFEYCGKQILVWQSKKTDNPLSIKKVEEWKLQRVIDELFHCNIITDGDTRKMHYIRRLRNYFIHEEYSLRLSSQIAQRVIASIQDVINCTTLLKAEYDKWV
jgi:hypothetical protein